MLKVLHNIELRMKSIMLRCIIISVINVFPVYADFATPSNMSYNPGDVVVEEHPTIDIDELEDENLEIFYDELFDGSAASDRTVAEYIKDLFLTALYETIGDPVEESEEEEEIDISIAEDREVMKNESIGLLSGPNRASFSPYYKNVVIYIGSFNNYDAELVFPYSALQNLCVIDGKLVNVGTSAVTGRILYDGELLDPSVYDSYTYTLNPVYGSTTSVYNYGSFNYRRHYFLQNYGTGQRITYEDMYGNFLVEDYKVYFSSSERTYYALLFILLSLGVGYLWIRRH